MHCSTFRASCLTHTEKVHDCYAGSSAKKVSSDWYPFGIVYNRVQLHFRWSRELVVTSSFFPSTTRGHDFPFQLLPLVLDGGVECATVRLESVVDVTELFCVG